MTRRKLASQRSPRRGLLHCCYSLVTLGALMGCSGEIGGDLPGTGPNGTGGGDSPGAGTNGGPTAGTAPGATAGTGSGGTSSTAGAGSIPTPGGGTAGPDPEVPGDPTAAGPMPLRYMTSREYLNTVSELLGDTSLTEEDVPTETTDLRFLYFPFRVPGTVGNFEAESLQFAAEKLAANALPKLSTIMPCTPANASAEAGCATQFINTFGAKAYRRPLTAEETTRFNALYQTARTTLALDFNNSITVLIEAMLQSPNFYYHWQKDTGAAKVDGSGKVELGPYTLANRLSYFLWGTAPDQALLDAAKNGQLSTDAQLDAQVRRMLQNNKAKGMVSDFITDLLDMDVLDARPKDQERYGMFPSLQAPMRTEVQNFTVNIVFGTGKFDDLFTSTATSLNQALAGLYGVSGITGMDFKPATLNGSQRGGLLSLAGFMANTGTTDGSLPPRRGNVIYTRFMCHQLPDPPNEIPAPPGETENVTTRQRFEQHNMNPCTGACHKILDGIGFAFENYDGVGAYRATEHGAPVNASTVFTLDGAERTFANALELQRAMATSDEVRSCFSKQWLRYAFRRLETEGDAASLQAATNQFKAGNDIRELIVALVKSRTFRFRTPAANEVL